MMRYFLIIGLMMAGSVAQADICIPLWWKLAIDVQVEIESDLKGPLAMNEPCIDEGGKMPATLALENSKYPLVFEAIMENFELDGRALYQIRLDAGRRLQRDYEELLLRAEVFETDESELSPSDLVDEFRRMRPSFQRETLRMLGVSDEYYVYHVSGTVNGHTVMVYNTEYGDGDIEMSFRDGAVYRQNGLLTYVSRGELMDSEEPIGQLYRYVNDRFNSWSGPTDEEIEAYQKALEKYNTSLAIYNIMVPSSSSF